jgi:hypothetical protein
MSFGRVSFDRLSWRGRNFFDTVVVEKSAPFSKIGRIVGGAAVAKLLGHMSI